MTIRQYDKTIFDLTMTNAKSPSKLYRKKVNVLLKWILGQLNISQEVVILLKKKMPHLN